MGTKKPPCRAAALRTGICPACRSSEWPGMRLKPSRNGMEFWANCLVCNRKERITFLPSGWLSPDVMEMLLGALREVA
jgi:hypothetical protein